MREVTQFISGVKSELSKVVWPKWDEFVGSTIVVFFLVAFFAVYLFGLDLGINTLASYIFERYGVS